MPFFISHLQRLIRDGLFITQGCALGFRLRLIATARQGGIPGFQP